MSRKLSELLKEYIDIKFKGKKVKEYNTITEIFKKRKEAFLIRSVLGKTSYKTADEWLAGFIHNPEERRIAVGCFKPFISGLTRNCLLRQIRCYYIMKRERKVFPSPPTRLYPLSTECYSKFLRKVFLRKKIGGRKRRFDKFVFGHPYEHYKHVRGRHYPILDCRIVGCEIRDGKFVFKLP